MIILLSSIQINRKILHAIFSMLLFATQIFAQPGGGGGLEIGGLYNKNLEAIDLRTDTALKIRTFILSGERVIEEAFPYKRRHVYGVADDIQIMMFNSPMGLGYPGQGNTHRMYILYKDDTMIVNFIEIMAPNGAGNRDHMDSLVIQKGSFEYCRLDDDYWLCHSYECYKNSKCMEYGLTPYTVKELEGTGDIEYNPSIDISFIEKMNPPTSFLMNTTESRAIKNEAVPNQVKTKTVKRKKRVCIKRATKKRVSSTT